MSSIFNLANKLKSNNKIDKIKDRLINNRYYKIIEIKNIKHIYEYLYNVNGYFISLIFKKDMIFIEGENIEVNGYYNNIYYIYDNDIGDMDSGVSMVGW